MNYVLFQERLKNILDEKNIMIKDLASNTNLYADQISRWLNGKRTPKEEKIELIAKSLEVNQEWLKGNFTNEFITFCLTLFELLKSNNISNEEFCIDNSIEINLLENWLAQKTMPSQENINKICKYFSIEDETDLFNSNTYKKILDNYRNNSIKQKNNVKVIKYGNVTISIIDNINERDYLEINKILIDNLK